MSLSRRNFIAKSSFTIASFALAPRSLSALTSCDLASSPEKFLSESEDEDALRLIAKAAIDASMSAGAQYSDIRIVERQVFKATLYAGRIQPQLDVGASLSYGIRVLVNNTWGFVHGQLPSLKSVTLAAKSAVLQARTNSAFAPRVVNLIPAPVVTGEWNSPLDILPFTVSLRDQTVHMGAINAAIMRVRGTALGSGTTFNWVKETKIYASSEGSSITQRFTRSLPSIRIAAGEMFKPLIRNFPDVIPGTAGYESITSDNLQLQIKRAAEETVRIYNMPIKSMDVGRFPIVASGADAAKLFGETVSPALELDRALGFESNASGTSFLSPPKEVLKAQTPVFAPFLSATSNRNAPDISAAKWDDEGVVSEEYKIIKAGRVVDYYTTRETAAHLLDWYSEHGMPIRSHGCAVSGSGDTPPFTVGGHTIINSDTQTASLDTLIKYIKKGILLYDAKVEPEPGLSTAIIHGTLLQIVNGNVTARIAGTALSVRTIRLWKESLDTFGDSNTLQSTVIERYKGHPWQQVYQTVTAPAILFKDVDVVNYGRKN